MITKLYLYDTTIDLLYDNGTMTCVCNQTDSRPMNERLVKLHKGMDNEVHFRIMNSDRKKVGIEHLRVVASLVNVDNRERVMQKYCTNDPQKGMATLNIDEGDLVNIASGHYDLVISGEQYTYPETSGYVRNKPFYTDTASNIQLKAEVIPTADDTPLPTDEVVTGEWMQESISATETVFTSSAFMANRIKNHTRGTHTIAIFGNNFTGKVEVLGSLDHTPPSSPDKYFPVSVIPFNNEILYTEFTGVDPFVFSANVMWLKFRYWPDNTALDAGGEITKIQLRS